MSARHRHLGRGLDALLSTPPAGAPESSTASKEGQLQHLPVDLLQRGRYQPRLDMRPETLEDLADSIKAQGVVQPVVVRPVESGPGASRYEIIAGERRWRAAQLAGLEEIPAVIRDVTDQAAVAMSLIENIQRENLNPLEEARALERLIDEFEMTHQKAAEAVGRSRAAVTNLIRLLDLCDDVKAMVEARRLEMGHARALLGLIDPAKQTEAARRVVSKGLSVRETERLVKRMVRKAVTGESRAPRRDPDILKLESELGERLGAKVAVNHRADGKGRLTISYNSLEELDGILGHIQ